MRVARLALVIATIGVALSGCDSTQPSNIGAATASIRFSADGLVGSYDCWELWADISQPPDGVPDDLNQLFCEQLFVGGNPEVPVVDSRPIPWRYSIAITVIRAGQTQEELIATSIFPGDTIDDFISMTGYDTIRSVGPTRGFDGTFYYVTPGASGTQFTASARVSSGNQLWLESQGVLGEENIMGEPPPFDVELNEGDTLIVRARKQRNEDAPYLPLDPQLVLTGTVTLGGTQIQLLGTPSSTSDNMAAVTFSFTRQ